MKTPEPLDPRVADAIQGLARATARRLYERHQERLECIDRPDDGALAALGAAQIATRTQRKTYPLRGLHNEAQSAVHRRPLLRPIVLPEKRAGR